MNKEEERRIPPHPPIPKELREWLRQEVDRRRRMSVRATGSGPVKRPAKLFDLADGDPYEALLLAIRHKDDE